MQLEFTQKEMEYLQELVEHSHADLREEIHRTDDFKFKQELKERERTAEGVLCKLLNKRMTANA
jgi:hypothetical protein